MEKKIKNAISVVYFNLNVSFFFVFLYYEGVFFHQHLYNQIESNFYPYMNMLYVVDFAVIIILISIIYLLLLDLQKSIRFGLLGNILYLSAIILELIIRDFDLTPRFSNINYMIRLLLLFILISGLFSLNLFLFKMKAKQVTVKDALVKKTILDLGTQYTRLEVREISEACKVDKSIIVTIIDTMIQHKEIHAEYFKSSRAVVFDQQANIDEIDELMAKYKEWEEQQVGKTRKEVFR